MNRKRQLYTCQILPISHLCPEYPLGHLQVYVVVPVGEQAPLFRHGFGEQGFGAEDEKLIRISNTLS